MRKLVLAFQCDLRWDQLEGTARARNCTACESRGVADNDGRLCVRYACAEVPESTQRVTLERADGRRMKIMFRVDRDGF